MTHGGRNFVLVGARLFVFILCSVDCLGALMWQQHPGFSSAPLVIPQAGKVGFTSLPPSSTGINFTNQLPEARYKTNQVLFNGSGVAAGDIDGDGLCDLYFAQLEGPNMLFRNLGNWKFEEIAVKAGVDC